MNEGKLTEALETIDHIYTEIRARQIFIARVAHAYLKQGDVDAAMSAITERYDDVQGQGEILTLVAQCCYSARDNAGMSGMIQAVVRNALQDHMVQSGQEALYREIVSASKDLVEDFFAHLTAKCLQHTKQLFLHADIFNASQTQALFKKIVALSTSRLTLENFCNLKERVSVA